MNTSTPGGWESCIIKCINSTTPLQESCCPESAERQSDPVPDSLLQGPAAERPALCRGRRHLLAAGQRRPGLHPSVRHQGPGVSRVEGEGGIAVIAV